MPFALPIAEDFASFEKNINEIARQIVSRAPQAQVVFMQYVTLIPQTPCADATLFEENIAGLRATADRLAKLTQSAAHNHGALVLNMDELAKNHTACDKEPRRLRLPTQPEALTGMPWHPNPRGMEIIAKHLENTLGRFLAR